MDKNLQKLVSEYMIVTPDIGENDILIEDLTKEEGLAGLFLVLTDEKVRAFEDSLVESEIPQRRAHMRQLLSQENALQVILMNLLRKGGYNSYLEVLKTMFNSLEELLGHYNLIENTEDIHIPSDIIEPSESCEAINTDYIDVEDEPLDDTDEIVIEEEEEKSIIEPECVQPNIKEEIVEEKEEKSIIEHECTPSNIKEEIIDKAESKPTNEIKVEEPVKTMSDTQSITTNFEDVKQSYVPEDNYIKTENNMLKEQNKQLNETLVAMQDMMKSFMEMQQSQVKFNNVQDIKESAMIDVSSPNIEAVQPIVEDDSLTDEEFYSCIEIVKSKVGSMPTLDFLVKEFRAGNRDSAAESLEQIIINLEKGGVKFD